MILLLLLAAGPSIGASEAEVRRNLPSLELVAASAPRAASRALAGGELLHALHAVGLTPKTPDGRLDTSRWTSFGFAADASADYVLAFDRRGLALALIKERVPPAGPPTDPARLAPLFEAVARRGLAPARKDSRGNAVAWGRAGARAFYAPSADRLYVLLHDLPEAPWPAGAARFTP